MFDVWFGKVELTEVIIYFSIFVLVPTQLFLCFKANNEALKLLPVGILALLLVIFLCMIQLVPGWDGIGYAILAMFAGILLVACSISWGIWFAVKVIKGRKK